MDKKENAKAYQRIRHWLHLVSLLLTLFILASVLVFGLSNQFYAWASSLGGGSYVTLALYFLFFSIYTMALGFPLSVYSGYRLEHRFSLSNQTLSAWFQDYAKRQLLSFLVAAILVLALYALIWNAGSVWWVWAWLGYAGFGLVLGKLFPVLIIPLFYKYSPIADAQLKRKIEALAAKHRLSIENVYSLNLSRTTKKANAVFTGLGKTKRVILSDTLLNSFTHDEIEAVLAHELGHYQHKDIWKQFGLGTVFTFAGFGLIAAYYGPLAAALNFSGIADMRAFPLLCLMSFVFGLVAGPLSNMFSRRAERQADQFALRVMGVREPFVTCMEKLAELNLADPNPHPLIEFLLYDHPAVGRRIQMAREYQFT
jgi:STE24 endopeptidase